MPNIHSGKYPASPRVVRGEYDQTQDSRSQEAPSIVEVWEVETLAGLRLEVGLREVDDGVEASLPWVSLTRWGRLEALRDAAYAVGKEYATVVVSLRKR